MSLSCFEAFLGSWAGFFASGLGLAALEEPKAGQKF
jgi:hypothetical protein